METLPWYKSAIVRQQIVAFIIAAAGLLKFKFDFDVDATVAAILAGVAAIIPVWTIITRIFKPAPNLSQTAVDKEIEMVRAQKIPPSPIAAPMKQGGYARFELLAMIVAIVFCLGLALAGCAGTQAAYKAAPLHGAAVADTAYVVAEHYYAVVKEAAELKNSGRVPAPMVAGMQAADRKVKPLILGDPATNQPGLQQVSEKYTALHDAKTEEQLQLAVNDAVIALADLIRAVKSARGQ